MKWVFLLLLVAKGNSEALDEEVLVVVEEEGDCSLPTDIACNLNSLENLEGGLQDRCRSLLVAAECMIRIEEKCHFNDGLLDMAKNTLPNLKQLCGRASASESMMRSFQRSREKENLLSSLQCIKGVLNDQKTGYCASQPCKFKLIKYAEVLLEKEIISDVDLNMLMCIGGMNAYVCLAVSIEKKCGKSAFNQYINIIETMPYPVVDTCSRDQFKDFFPTMLKVYKDNERADDLLRNVFKTPRL